MSILKFSKNQIEKFPVIKTCTKMGVKAGLDTLLEDFRSFTHFVIGLELLILERHHEAVTELKAACFLLFLQGGAFLTVKFFMNDENIVEEED